MPAIINQDKCVGSGDCVDSCPTECIEVKDGKGVVDEDSCADCGACVDVCPTEAITLD